MTTVRIARQERRDGKTTVFAAELVACVVTSGEYGKTRRPEFAVFAGSDESMRPFVANLRLGAVASAREPRDGFEFLKSAKHIYAMQRTPHGTTVTVYLPTVVRHDPGMIDPERASFVCLPTRAWLDASATRYAREIKATRGYFERHDEYRADLLAAVPLFAAYLDRRTRCPIPPEFAFQARMLDAFLRSRHAMFAGEATRGYENGLERVGMWRALCFGANQDVIEETLAREIAEHYGHNTKTKTRSRAV